MVAIGLFLMFLGVKKEYEPLLLVPIGFGTILANLPATGLLLEGGLLEFFKLGIEYEILPPLVFLGIGALTSFAPLLASPSMMLLGMAAQMGIFLTLMGAMAIGFDPMQSAAIGIIGGADGPTAIFAANRLAPELLGPIAIAAYSYMAMVPLVQPPVIKALTTRRQRGITMQQSVEVSKRVEILFPVVCVIITILLIPSAAPLIGMLMLGNFLRVCGVTDRLSNVAQESIINTVTLFLGVAVGASMPAQLFWQWETLGILFLGIVAFVTATACGVGFGQIMYWLSGGRVNPVVGAAGVSAVPMAARVAHKVGQEANHNNYLLMVAMGANISGVIGSALAAGVLVQLVPFLMNLG
ncbi:MAG: sodium ion-translocating decarboxylase subunit beta [bacterium]